MRIYKIAKDYLLPVLTRDQMVEFIIGNDFSDWSGKLDYNDAKEIAGLSDEWKLTYLPLSLFDWVSDSTYSGKTGKSLDGLEFPPIVLKTGDGGYEVLDGKHRIGMAKDRGEEQIQVYLGMFG